MLIRRVLVVITAAILLMTGVQAQSGATREWAFYGGDLAHTRYSPLDQITAQNFNKLEVAWRFKTDSLGPRPEYAFNSTPLMVNGLVYSTAGSRRAVVALDAATGEMIWMHSEQEGARGAQAPRALSGRGLSYWTDGKERRILYVTPGYRLVALDAMTGQRVSTFGKDGIVDLKTDFDQTLDLVNARVGLHAPVTIANDVILVGAAFDQGFEPPSKTNVKGYVRGFDVRTGKRLWIFHMIPRPGEFGNDTWLNDSWSYTGNTGVWSQISVDPELGLAYFPGETPTHDLYGGERPGNNLFAESIIALDIKTGKRRWHYQLVHHGIWDSDIPCAPILMDITVDGRRIKALAQPTKQAMLYVFNRETGEPVWPIEERPVPKGDTPGEWYSPTQPFQPKIPPYDRNGFTVDDLIDFTPELKAEGLALISKYRIGPMFTPPSVSRAEGPIATLTMGNVMASTSWPGGSYDPETQTLYVSSQSRVGALGLIKPAPGKSDFPYLSGTVSGGGGDLTVQGLPLMKPPYSRVTAIDMSKGEIKWMVPFGATPDTIKNHPALKGLNLPPMGAQQNHNGTLVTKTLLIIGEKTFSRTPNGQRGAMLHAYDKATGKELGAVYMPAPQSGSPMTYQVNGTQYLVVAVSGAGFPGELIAFKVGS